MNAVKKELIDKINGYSDDLNQKEILEQLIIDQKLEDSLLSFATKGGIMQEQAKAWLKKRQTQLMSNS